MQHSKVQSILILTFLILCQHAFSQEIPFCEKGKWGFAATDGTMIIPCVYDEVGFFSEDNLAKVKKTGKYGYINKKGVAVVPFEYDECYRIYEVYHAEYSVGIENNPKIHLNTDFDFQDIPNNRYIVSKSKSYGVISLIAEKPKVLVPLIYSNIQFDPGKKTFHCSKDKRTLYFNMDGKKLTPEQVNEIKSNEYATVGLSESNDYPVVVKVKGKVGVIRQPLNSWGKMNYDTIVPAMYDDIITEKFDKNYMPGDDIFGVRMNNKWGLVGDKKNTILPIRFDSINFELSREFRHWADYKRLFVVRENNRWGILGKRDDKTDTLTTFLPFEYDAIDRIYYSYLLVKKENKFQIFSIDKYKLISHNSYSSVTKYEHESVNGFVLFQVTNKLGQTVYIGKNGMEFFTD